MSFLLFFSVRPNFGVLDSPVDARRKNPLVNHSRAEELWDHPRGLSPHNMNPQLFVADPQARYLALVKRAGLRWPQTFPGRTQANINNLCLPSFCFLNGVHRPLSLPSSMLGKEDDRVHTMEILREHRHRQMTPDEGPDAS